MPDHYTITPVIFTLAERIYHAQAEYLGRIISVPFARMTARERAPFLDSAARVLISFQPRARTRIAKRVKSTPKPAHFEVWSLSRELTDSRLIIDTSSIDVAVDAATSFVTSRALRVRTFYDRHRKRRIVQFLRGNGVAVRHVV